MNRGKPRRLYPALVALLIAASLSVAPAANDPKVMSAQLSDKAFALLTSLTKDRDSPSPLLGPIGVFAADAQKLSAALAGGHRQAAALAMASLKADAETVDKAASGAGADAAKWKAIRGD